MDTFEYLAALVSVVVGLGVAQALRGVGHLVHARKRVPMYGPHLFWLVNVVLWMVVYWWFSFGLAQLPEWRLPDLLWVLGYAAGIYFLVALLLPDPMPADFDARAHFHETRPWFYGALFCVGLLEIADYFVKTVYQEVLPRQTGLQLGLYLALLVLWLVGSLVARTSTDDRVHGGFALIFFLAVASWTTYLTVW